MGMGAPSERPSQDARQPRLYPCPRTSQAGPVTATWTPVTEPSPVTPERRTRPALGAAAAGTGAGPDRRSVSTANAPGATASVCVPAPSATPCPQLTARSGVPVAKADAEPDTRNAI